MSDINFLKNSSMIKSEAVKENSSNLSKKIFFISLGVVIIGYVGCFGLNEFFKLRTKMLTTNITEFNNIKQMNSEIKIYDQKIKDISDIINKQDSNYIIQSDNLKLIADLIPNDVKIDNYTIDDEKTITLQGKTNNKEGMSYFLEKLRESKVFKEIGMQSLDSVAKEAGAGNSTYSFSIILK